MIEDVYAYLGADGTTATSEHPAPPSTSALPAPTGVEVEKTAGLSHTPTLVEQPYAPGVVEEPALGSIETHVLVAAANAVAPPPVVPPKSSYRPLPNVKPPRIIMEHFDLTTYKVDTAHGYVEADCRHCSHTIKGQRNVTSNFIQHMRRRHPEAYAQFAANSAPRTKRPRLSARNEMSSGAESPIPNPLTPNHNILSCVPAPPVIPPRPRNPGGHATGKSNVRERVSASHLVAGIQAAAANVQDNTLERSLLSPIYRGTTVTPCDEAQSLSDRFSCFIYLKREDKQPTGSPLFRAAYNYIASTPTSRAGVIAGMPSAPAVALAAHKIGKPCAAVVPLGTPAVVVRALRQAGAEVSEEGRNNAECCRYARSHAGAMNRTYVDLAGKTLLTGYAEASAGYASMALEILRELPGLNTVFLPAGNALMFSGVSAILQRLGQNVKLVAVCMEDELYEGCEEDPGAIGPTLDRLGNGAVPGRGWIRGRGAELSLEPEYDDEGDWKAFVSNTVSVNRHEVSEAVKAVFEECESLVLSPFGALSVAGAIKTCRKLQLQHERYVCVISDPLRDFGALRRIAVDYHSMSSAVHCTVIDCESKDGNSIVALMASLHGRRENKARVVRIEYDGKWPFALVVQVKDKVQHETQLKSIGFKICREEDNNVSRVEGLVGGCDSDEVVGYEVRIDEKLMDVARLIAEVGRLGQLRRLKYTDDGSGVGRVEVQWSQVVVRVLEEEVRRRVCSYRRLLCGTAAVDGVNRYST